MPSSLFWALPTVACFLSTLPSITQSTIYYVSNSLDISSSDEDRTGLSWSDAFSSLEDGLSAITQPDDELWISRGIYYPDTASRKKCFTIEASFDISIYGGFYGNETDINQRELSSQSETILDGDIGEIGDISDNCYHIISLIQTSILKQHPPKSNVIIDGITFQNGNANSNGDGFDTNQYGGVLYAGDITGSIIITFEQCHFISNKAHEGGAIWASGGNVGIYITDCVFFHNMATKGIFKGGYGGAIVSTHKNNMIINDTLFFNNSGAHRGGAIYGDYGSKITCDSCSFWSNNATEGHGGAWFMEDRNYENGGTFAYVENCEFEGNGAQYFGGAICWFNGVFPTIIHTKFIQNKAELGGAITNFDQIYYDGNWINNYFEDNYAFGDENANDIYNDSLLTIDQLENIESDYQIDILEELGNLWDQREITYQFNDDLDESGYKCYVNINICDESLNCPDDLDGITWDTAFYRIQDCLDKIKDDGPWTVYNPEIWVASGIYTPSRSPEWAQDDIEEYYSFIMYPNIHMYGGFDGTEQSRSERNWYENPTYLSCKINEDTYCSTILDAAQNCIVDGFIFQESRYYDTDYTTDEEENNRRLLQNRLSFEDIQVALTFDEIAAITTPGRGGGVHSNGTNIVIANSIFTDMVATKGGGMYCIGYTGGVMIKYPEIWNTAFISNIATKGAAIAADAWCHYECHYCYFEDNRCTEKGGAVYLDWQANGHHINNVFYANDAFESGGAIAADGSSIPVIKNTTFIENGAVWEGGALYCGSHHSAFAAGLVLINLEFDNNEAPFGTDDIWLWQNCFITDIWNGTNYMLMTTTTSTPGIFDNNDNNNNNNKNTIGGLEIGVFIVLIGIISLVICMLCGVCIFCCHKRNKRRRDGSFGEKSHILPKTLTDDNENERERMVPMKTDLSPIGHVHPTIGAIPADVDTDAEDSHDTDVDVSDDQDINNNNKNNLHVDQIDAAISSDDAVGGGISGNEERSKFEL